MDGASPQSRVVIPVYKKNGIRYAIAGPQDDADVRRILSEVAMDGWVQVSMTREPEMSAAHRALGQSGEFIIVRKADSREAIGVGEYHVSSLFLNGVPTLVPYAGALRVLPKWRNRISLLRNGLDFARCLQAHRGDPPFMLTSIASDNDKAIRLLTANLAGMPDYHFIGGLVTMILPVSRAEPCKDVRPAVEKDLPRISSALRKTGECTQLMPVWGEQQLLQAMTVGDLGLNDFCVLETGGQLSGGLAVWDQRTFRQVQVKGYAPWLGRFRPAYNLWARLRRKPTMPRPGLSLPQVTLSHFLPPADEAAAIKLVAHGLHIASEKGAKTALLGLAEDHPLLAVIRSRFRALDYKTNLYLVSWKTGPPPPTLENGPILAPEIAVL